MRQRKLSENRQGTATGFGGTVDGAEVDEAAAEGKYGMAGPHVGAGEGNVTHGVAPNERDTVVDVIHQALAAKQQGQRERGSTLAARTQGKTTTAPMRPSPPAPEQGVRV